MATRNRTEAFKNFRKSKNNKRLKTDRNPLKQGLLVKDVDFELEERGISIDEPEWCKATRDIQIRIDEIKSEIDVLKELQRTALLPMFNMDDESTEATVQQSTETIKQLISDVKNCIHGLDKFQFTHQGKIVKKNVQSNFAFELGEQSKQFSRLQKKYLDELQKKKYHGKTLFRIVEEEEHVRVEFSPKQKSVIDGYEKAILEREKVIVFHFNPNWGRKLLQLHNLSMIWLKFSKIYKHL
jgi:hypothetical protein